MSKQQFEVGQLVTAGSMGLTEVGTVAKYYAQMDLYDVRYEDGKVRWYRPTDITGVES